MLMYSANDLDYLLQLCKQHDIITIADEVMTGFGRTGTLFATEQTKHKPDIICVSKGITGGVLPLGVTACHAHIAEAFGENNVFYHGHSYTANPIVCAAACASLDIINNENTLQKIQHITQSHHAFVQTINNHPATHRIQATGTILAIDLKTNEQPGYTNSIRLQAINYFKKQGILIRPLGNVLYILPPYCISTDELKYVYQRILNFINTH